MKIFPPVLFLTFAGFLPNDCDAMFGQGRVGQPIFHPENSGMIEVTSQQDVQFRSVLMMDPIGISEPEFLYESPENNFEHYMACLITYPDLLHKSGDLASERARRLGYVETTYKPKSVAVMALNIHYDEFEQNWHEHDPNHRLLHPNSKEFARLYITIPNTKQVLYKLFREREAPAGVNYEAVRKEALQKINEKIRARASILGLLKK